MFKDSLIQILQKIVENLYVYGFFFYAFILYCFIYWIYQSFYFLQSNVKFEIIWGFEWPFCLISGMCHYNNSAYNRNITYTYFDILAVIQFQTLSTKIFVDILNKCLNVLWILNLGRMWTKCIWHISDIWSLDNYVVYSWLGKNLVWMNNKIRSWDTKRLIQIPIQKEQIKIFYYMAITLLKKDKIAFKLISVWTNIHVFKKILNTKHFVIVRNINLDR